MGIDMANNTKVTGKKRQGTELFYVDENGKRQDAALHAEMLGPEEDDPFGWDLDAYIEMSPAEQEAFMQARYPPRRGS